MPKRRLFHMSLGLVLVAVLVGFFVWYAAEERAHDEAQRARTEERRREREVRRGERLARLGDESRALIPDPLRGVELGMPLSDLRERRAHITPKLGQSPEPGMEYYEEELPNRSQVVYGVATETERLAQIQVLSVLPSAEAFEAHFTAMIDEYGTPTSIWDCPQTGNVPTRRFVWRRAETAIADILLIYGDRISVTLYIAPAATIGASLERAACRPLENRDQLLEFPATTLEEIQRTAQEQGAH